jgi:hypothetical protein
VRECVGRRGEWVAPVDDRCDPSRLDEVREAFQVGGVFACDERGESLAGDE